MQGSHGLMQPLFESALISANSDTQRLTTGDVPLLPHSGPFFTGDLRKYQVGSSQTSPCKLVLYLTKQQVVLVVRLTAVGSEFCLRNVSAQKKYWHNQEWDALVPFCQESLALSQWARLISGLWTSFKIYMETKPRAKISVQGSKTEVLQQLPNAWK